MHFPRRSAFTLVELLVVIGIIAILISLLLPALSKARETATTVKCMSNMRQYAVACTTYANDNKGFLPPYWREERVGGSHYFSDPTNNVPPNATTSMRDTSVALKNTCGGGRLFEKSYLRSDAIFFCPSSIDPTRNLDAFPRPLLSDPALGYDTSYHFNPHWTRPNPGTAYSLTNRGVPAYRKLNQFKNDRALLVEFLSTVSTASHWSNRRKTAGWNLAFADGHVVTAFSSEATEILNAMGSINGVWRRFDDVRDMLEATASGRDAKVNPRTGVRYPAGGWDTYRVHPSGEY